MTLSRIVECRYAEYQPCWMSWSCMLIVIYLTFMQSVDILNVIMLIVFMLRVVVQKAVPYEAKKFPSKFCPFTYRKIQFGMTMRCHRFLRYQVSQLFNAPLVFSNRGTLSWMWRAYINLRDCTKHIERAWGRKITPRLYHITGLLDYHRSFKGFVWQSLKTLKLLAFSWC